MVFEGSLSAGVLIGVNMLIGKIFRPAQSLVEFPGEMKKLSQLLDSFASATSLTTENRTSGNFHDIVGSISFQDVSFIRDQTTPVMENVSFSIDVHETVGICYSQDNTLCKLSGAFVARPLSHYIWLYLLDGNDISTFNIQHLRSNIALVDKTNHFFPGSLRDNFKEFFQMQIMTEFYGHANCKCRGASTRTNVSPETQMEELQGIWNADLKLNSLCESIT